MASYTAVATDVGVHGKTLTANAVDTVTLGVDADSVIVFSDGTAALYFTVDGTTPTVAGQNTHVLPSGLKSARKVSVPTAGNTVVKLISAGTTGYGIEAGSDEPLTFGSPGSAAVQSVGSSTASKGNGKLAVSGSTALSSISGGIPSGATKALFRPDVAVTINDDGTAADANDYPLAANVDWVYDGDRLSAVKFNGSGNVYVWFYA